MMPGATGPGIAVGDEVELEIGPPAHGGWCVARHHGQVLFVSQAIPGEVVRARITEVKARFGRAVAVKVLQASPDRVELAWPQAGPDGVGGAELAHVSLPAQRAWKAQVVREQLEHLAHVHWDGEVEEAPGDDANGGWGYRTRLSLIADAAGRPGMFLARSHEVRAVGPVPLAVPEIQELDIWQRTFAPGARIEIAAPVGGAPLGVLVGGEPVSVGGAGGPTGRRTKVREQVPTPYGTARFTVGIGSFWQVHRLAPALLVDAVCQGLGDVTGGHVADLYAGAGLFAWPLSQAVGPAGQVSAVEADSSGVAAARRNLHACPQVSVIHGDVARVLSDLGPLDAVVLDPPRAGAVAGVMGRVAASGAGTVVYVACDPAALGRDLGLARTHGFELEGLRALDLFPHTHHVECVAILRR